MACESLSWQIIARAHNEEWELYDPRASASTRQETHSPFMPDGMVAIIEGNAELADEVD